MAYGQTLRTVLGIWRDAVDAYSAGDLAASVDLFLRVEDLSARMLYNMAAAYTRLDKTTLALQCLSAAVKKDTHLAIAFFQKGTLNFKQNNFTCAIEDLSQAKTLMRGNNFIDYKPLGMITRLGKFEILYNLALACLHDNRSNEAEGLFTEALHDADVRQRKLLMSALEHVQDKNYERITPIEISLEKIFTPPKSVVDNLEKRKVVPSAKVVSASDRNDTDPTFNGKKRVEELRLSPQSSPKPPRSPLLKVRQFLKKRRHKSASLEGMSSVGAMRSAASTGDLQSVPMMRQVAPGRYLSHSLTSASFTQLNTSFDDGSSISSQTDSPTSSLDEFDMRPRTNSAVASFRIVHSVSLDSGCQAMSDFKESRQRSIEEACTSSANCIAQALTSNCDVTIVVTPPATNDSNNNINFLRGAVKDTSRSSDNNSPITQVEMETNIATTPCVSSDKVDSNEIKNTNVTVSQDSCDGSSGNLRKSRPPPPSYPPPPLPSTVVFTV